MGISEQELIEILKPLASNDIQGRNRDALALKIARKLYNPQNVNETLDTLGLLIHTPTNLFNVPNVTEVPGAHSVAAKLVYLKSRRELRGQ